MSRGSGPWVLAMLLVPLIALAAPSTAQETEGPHQVTLFAHDVGEEHWFMTERFQGERNPVVRLPPGAEVEVVFRNSGTKLHNVYFTHPVDARLELVESGRSGSIRFVVPEDTDGEALYWCDPHQRLGMQGTVRFEAPREEGFPIPTVGPLLLLALGALGLHRLRRAGPVAA